MVHKPRGSPPPAPDRNFSLFILVTWPPDRQGGESPVEGLDVYFDRDRYLAAELDIEQPFCPFHHGKERTEDQTRAQYVRIFRVE